MKPSKYNICLPYDDRFVVFNGVTKRFFLVSSQNKKAFLQILSTPDEYKEQYAPFLQRMAKEGFIIEDSVDEQEVVKQQYEKLNQSDEYRLMILPTYACNVRCWYCTQNHKNVRLSEGDVERIKKHIVYYLTTNKLKGLHLSWFGGEPIIDFRHIREIARFSKEYCRENHLKYRNSITTNGILLNKEILKDMADLEFCFFQITIDGTKEEHDKTKIIKKNSAYEVVLNNICLIKEIIPHAQIQLRYNYTKENLLPEKIIQDLNLILPPEVRKSINISIIKVWQQNENEIDINDIKRLVDLANSYGYHPQVGGGFRPCYVDGTHFNCIFPNGRVDKCDNKDIENCRGHINECGKIIWDVSPTFIKNSIFSNFENECTKCCYLPLCYGPCPLERDKKFVNIHCRYTDKKRTWENRLYFYCKQQLEIHNT